jgi:hypothetical protein
MPATEQTWWNLRLLHVVFAATAVALLAATVFVLTGDHNRPWKQYAREFRELETWNAQARIDEQDSKSYEARRDELEAALGDARRADLDGDVARAFITQVRTVTEDAQAADRAELDIDQLKSQQDPEQRLVVRGDLLARLRDIVKRTKFREDNLAGALKLRRAELDKNRADYELAVAEEAPADRQAANAPQDGEVPVDVGGGVVRLCSNSYKTGANVRQFSQQPPGGVDAQDVDPVAQVFGPALEALRGRLGRELADTGRPRGDAGEGQSVLVGALEASQVGLAAHGVFMSTSGLFYMLPLSIAQATTTAHERCEV